MRLSLLKSLKSLVIQPFERSFKKVKEFAAPVMAIMQWIPQVFFSDFSHLGTNCVYYQAVIYRLYVWGQYQADPVVHWPEWITVQDLTKVQPIFPPSPFCVSVAIKKGCAK